LFRVGLVLLAILTVMALFAISQMLSS